MAKLPTRLAVAMHEAGHVAARMLTPGGPPIHSATLSDGDGDMLGFVDTLAEWQPSRMETAESSPATEARWRTFAWNDILFYLCGPLAEMRWRRRSRAFLWLVASELAERCVAGEDVDDRSDLGRVRRRLRWLHPGEERDAFIRGWLEAEELVARNISAIDWMGRELCDSGELLEDEIADMWTALKRAGLAKAPSGDGKLVLHPGPYSGA
ncbi:hypothetical protein U1763_02525 [Sphingomonas sp. LB2R24]|uniref:hypothetical protein n=1 Tax=Sphingomonas sorbitolis TaxID=3096165 RepID=UPI002FC5C089